MNQSYYDLFAPASRKTNHSSATLAAIAALIGFSTFPTTAIA